MKKRKNIICHWLFTVQNVLKKSTKRKSISTLGNFKFLSHSDLFNMSRACTLPDKISTKASLSSFKNASKSATLISLWFLKMSFWKGWEVVWSGLWIWTNPKTIWNNIKDLPPQLANLTSDKGKNYTMHKLAFYPGLFSVIISFFESN